MVVEVLDRLSRDQADVAERIKRLPFAGMQIVILADGEVNEFHVGLKGTNECPVFERLGRQVAS